MPIKFSSLTTKEIASTTKLVGLYSDNTSETGVSNCLVNTTDFAKKTELNTLEEGAVHKAGSETITGAKTFSNNNTFTGSNTFKSTTYCNRSDDGFQTITSKNTNLSIGTLPSTNTGFQIYAQDKDNDGYNNRIGGLFMYYSTSGTCITTIRAYKPDKTDATNASISINYPASGDPYTSAPTPAAGDNSTKIATTQWVTTALNTELNNVVHKTDAETISGNKTFNNNIILGSSSTLNATSGTLTAKTQAVTNNTTNVATTAFCQSLLKKCFGKTRPTLHMLYSNNEGLKTGDVTLSEKFTNYDIIIVVMGGDTSGHGIAYRFYPSWLLDYLLTMSTHDLDLASNASQYWNIYSYSKGSTTTFFKENDENARLYKIIGINIDGS